MEEDFALIIRWHSVRSISVILEISRKDRNAKIIGLEGKVEIDKLHHMLSVGGL